MFISTLGSSGIGLVWGWIVGSLADRLHRPNRNVLGVTLATLAISGCLLWLIDWHALPFFLGAALFAFLIHAGWRQELQSRSSPTDSN